MEALNTESPNQWRDSGRNESASHLSDSGFSPPNQQAASLTPDSPTKLSNNDLATEQMGEERSDRIRGGVKACVYVSGYEAPLGGRMPQRTTVAVAGPGREMPAAKVRLMKYSHSRLINYGIRVSCEPSWLEVSTRDNIFEVGYCLNILPPCSN